MKSKFDQTPEEWRPYNTTHQILSITQINIQRKTLIGMTEMTIVPTKPNLKKVKINAKQCRIYKIIMNSKHELKFDYYDLTQQIIPPDFAYDYTVGQFSEFHRCAVTESDPDAGGGEVLIHLPAEASHMIVEGRPFRLYLEYTLENPRGGLHFFVPEDPSSEEKAHMFSTRYENDSRQWFPCIDSYSEVCTWKLEFTVDENLTAISCGDLVEVVAVPKEKRKTFHYFMSIPTAAPNIGLAIGPFEIYVDPKMHEVTHFCLPGLLSLLIWTVRFTHEMFEFYEEALSTRYPYTCFKNVFVNEPLSDMTSYASMAIMDTNLMHTSAIIDQTYITRKFSALSIADQFYSCYISMQHSSDAWLSRGISNYLCGLYLKKFFGNNEYRHWIQAELKEVIKYEEQYGGIILDPSLLSATPKPKSSAGGVGNESNSSSNIRPAIEVQQNTRGGEGGFYFYLQSPHLMSPEYLRMYEKKSHLVIRMLESRIGAQLLLQVLNKQLSLALIFIQQSELYGHQGRQSALQSNPTSNATPPASAPGANPTSPMLISTGSFTRSIFTVTGKDMTVFMDQWVRQGGHVKFHMAFVFNRKRNTVELELKQECTQQLGVRKYVGPLTVALQELDGTFKHVLQIEGTHAKADIVCHSKSRRQKKKKIPLCTGEEVDMDLSAMDTESPVLWIRLDPDMTLLRSVDTRQPDFQWQYQLKHERDVTAQMEAIWALENFPTTNTRTALTDLIENEHTYYKVRCEACLCLAKVANAMVSASAWSGPPAMLNIFRKLFGCFSCPQIVRHNDFSNLQHYFIQKTIPVAMAGIRNVHGICPTEVQRFLIDLFKYNDNTRNRLSDNYYRAALVEALGNTITPVVAVHQIGSEGTTQALSKDTQAIMEEISRCLNLEKKVQCYKYTVTVECLRAIRKLQKFGHLPNRAEFFQTYAVYGQFRDVRLAALEAIVDYTRTDGNLTDVEYLLDIVEKDPVPRIRHKLCRIIIKSVSEKSADRRKTKSPFNNATVAQRIWNTLVNGKSDYSIDCRVRCDLMDLYHALFGVNKPTCLIEESIHDVEAASRRKSPLTTREGVEEFKIINDAEIAVAEVEVETPTMISAKVLSSKRESQTSDNSGELPEAMDTSLPTSFEPGMFKEPVPVPPVNDEIDIPMAEELEQGEDRDDEMSEASTSHKKHHHHHSKSKKKKEKKKRHKHKHSKHRHHEHKKKTKEETLSSGGSSGSNSPAV